MAFVPKKVNGVRRYGAWAGQPRGYPEDPMLCVAEVSRWFGRFGQCYRKRGHGPRGEFCKQHAKLEADNAGT